MPALSLCAIAQALKPAGRHHKETIGGSSHISFLAAEPGHLADPGITVTVTITVTITITSQLLDCRSPTTDFHFRLALPLQGP